MYKIDFSAVLAPVGIGGIYWLFIPLSFFPSSFYGGIARLSKNF